MRFFSIALCLGWMLAGGAAFAQENVVKTFDGTSAMTTPAFQVQDRWEVRWECADVISITLLAADGSVVAGTAGSIKGSLYQPKGGNFSLQIGKSAGAAMYPWHITVVELGSGPSTSDTNAVTNYVPPQIIYATGTTNTVSTPSAPATTNAAVTPSGPSNLTADQAHAVVVIKGDVMEGTGFLVKTADGPAVVTNLHVVSANPNVKILTTTGASIQILSLKGASDRDLAMFMIQDDHYSYLPLADDIKDTVQTDDEVITPGNSEGGEVVLDTTGMVLGVGPQLIEVSNPIYHGNSGGPIIHSKTGKVLAVVTGAREVNVSDALDKASFANKNSAITGSMRYFGLRIDTVPNWEVYDTNRFLNETTFLKNFHELSRCLDSYMNGASYEKAHQASTEENGHPDSRYYLRNDKIVAAHDTYHRLSTDADESQKLDAGREIVMDLEGIADADMDAIQNSSNFYGFDQIRAAQEVKYRKALRDEIDKIGNKISDLGH